jgi:hypothetical protein
VYRQVRARVHSTQGKMDWWSEVWPGEEGRMGEGPRKQRRAKREDT